MAEPASDWGLPIDSSTNPEAPRLPGSERVGEATPAADSLAVGHFLLREATHRGLSLLLVVLENVARYLAIHSLVEPSPLEWRRYRASAAVLLKEAKR